MCLGNGQERFALEHRYGELQEVERESEVGLGEWPRDLFWNDRGAASSIMSLKSLSLSLQEWTNPRLMSKALLTLLYVVRRESPQHLHTQKYETGTRKESVLRSTLRSKETFRQI